MVKTKHNTDTVLNCRDLCRRYTQGDNVISVLNQLNLSVSAGERVAIMGASGSGKSTLLGLLGALDKPDDGSVTINGSNIAKLNDDELSQLRNQRLGFVYQFHHLLPEFNAMENVAMPAIIAGRPPAEAMQLATDGLSAVGLDHRGSHRPGALSGGERQRVAIARALVNKPSVVLMDEPTGNLDEAASKNIQQLISELAVSLKMAFVLVTHDVQVASVMDTIYQLSEGRLSLVEKQH